jgi:hypothetical protein
MSDSGNVYIQATSGVEMKPKAGFQFVHAVLFMLAMLCCSVLLLLGNDAYIQNACLPVDASVSVSFTTSLQPPPSQNCPE